MSDEQQTFHTLMARAIDADRKSTEARHRKYTLIQECGYANPTWQAWNEVVKEAAAEIRGRFASSSFAHSQPSPDEMHRTSIVPSGYIPMRAEDIVGMAAAYADLEERLYRAEARLAEALASRGNLREATRALLELREAMTTGEYKEKR